MCVSSCTPSPHFAIASGALGALLARPSNVNQINSKCQKLFELNAIYENAREASAKTHENRVEGYNEMSVVHKQECVHTHTVGTHGGNFSILYVKDKKNC